MIRLITGVPGSGKSALMVDMILQFIDQNRPVFQHGIRDLKLPVETIYCQDPKCEFCTDREGQILLIDNYMDWAPPDAVIVLDEVQRQFRNRPQGSKVPEAVQGLETHRHKGIDFVMVTQSPKLIDQNIRTLVDQHIHLKNAPIGRYKYTFTECNNDPSRVTRDDHKEFYKPPKRVFDLYKSAEIHTKLKKPIPKPLIIMGIGLLIVGFFGYRAYSTMQQRINGTGPETAPEVMAQVPADRLPAPLAAMDSLAGLSQGPQITGGRIVTPLDKFDRKPQLEGVLESAPAYAGLVQNVTFPKLVGCIRSATRCKCYTQQGTDYPIDLKSCVAHIDRSASAFNPYVPDGAGQRAGAAGTAAAVPDSQQVTPSTVNN